MDNWLKCLPLYNQKETNSQLLHSLLTNMMLQKFKTNVKIIQLTDLISRNIECKAHNRLSKCRQTGSFQWQPLLDYCSIVHYVLANDNVLFFERLFFLWVGTLILIVFIFRKSSSHNLQTKSHPSLKVWLEQLFIHIFFLILPSGCDIYLL